jgi:hypothetical protein
MVDQEVQSMFMRCIWSSVLLAYALTLSLSGTATAADDGIVRIKSAYSMPETVKRLKMDVADKGIMFVARRAAA